MCAALLGLMLVCSTITCPGRGARGAALAQARGELGGEGAAVEEEVDVAAARDLGAPHAGRAGRAPARAARRSRGACGAALFARSKGAVSARSPSSTRGGYWKETSARSTSKAARAASLHRAGEALLNIQDHSQSSYRARGGSSAILTSFDPAARPRPGPPAARLRYHGNMIRKALLLALLPAAAQAAPARHFDVTATFAPAKKAGGSAAVVVTLPSPRPRRPGQRDARPAAQARPHPGRARGQAGARLGPSVPDYDPLTAKYLDTARPVSFPVGIAPTAPKGAHDVKASVVYFYCSTREAWCRRGVADVLIPAINVPEPAATARPPPRAEGRS